MPQEFIQSSLIRPAPIYTSTENQRLDFFGQNNDFPSIQKEYLPPNQYNPSLSPKNEFSARREESTARPKLFFGREPSTTQKPNFFPNDRVEKNEETLRVQGLPSENANNFGNGITVNVGSQRGESTPENSYGVPEDNLYNSPENYQDQSSDIEENNQEIVSKGNYYILTEDNTLQKVSYQTKQSDKNSEDNKFTAELKYEDVEPISDPVFAYNKNGQLIRILRKK